jgi:hypothetical protein
VLNLEFSAETEKITGFNIGEGDVLMYSLNFEKQNVSKARWHRLYGDALDVSQYLSLPTRAQIRLAVARQRDVLEFMAPNLLGPVDFADTIFDFSLPRRAPAPVISEQFLRYNAENQVLEARLTEFVMEIQVGINPWVEISELQTIIIPGAGSPDTFAFPIKDFPTGVTVWHRHQGLDGRLNSQRIFVNEEDSGRNSNGNSRPIRLRIPASPRAPRIRFNRGELNSAFRGLRNTHEIFVLPAGEIEGDTDDAQIADFLLRAMAWENNANYIPLSDDFFNPRVLPEEAFRRHLAALLSDSEEDGNDSAELAGAFVAIRTRAIPARNVSASRPFVTQLTPANE